MTPSSEPALIAAAVVAVVNAVLVVVVGHALDDGIQAALIALVTALAGLFIRSKVTPAKGG